MKCIKLIACDLDGTLLNAKKEITKENIDTIKDLKDALFVVATGRPLDGIKSINEQLGLNKKIAIAFAITERLLLKIVVIKQLPRKPFLIHILRRFMTMQEKIILTSMPS